MGGVQRKSQSMHLFPNENACCRGVAAQGLLTQFQTPPRRAHFLLDGQARAVLANDLAGRLASRERCREGSELRTHLYLRSLLSGQRICCAPAHGSHHHIHGYPLIGVIVVAPQCMVSTLAHGVAGPGTQVLSEKCCGVNAGLYEAVVDVLAALDLQSTDQWPCSAGSGTARCKRRQAFCGADDHCGLRMTEGTRVRMSSDLKMRARSAAVFVADVAFTDIAG